MDDILTYTIAEVSERLKITYRTLHYYEDKFELQINRDGAGNRIYTEQDVEILEKIVELKIKGMSLDGIKALFREKWILKPGSNDHLVVIDENTMELRDILLNEIGERIARELQYTNDKLDKVLQDNADLREELRKMQRQSEEHYSKIDLQLTAWRNKKPWFKKMFDKS